MFSSRKQQQQTTSIHEKKIDFIPAVIGKRKVRYLIMFSSLLSLCLFDIRDFNL